MWKADSLEAICKVWKCAFPGAHLHSRCKYFKLAWKLIDEETSLRCCTKCIWHYSLYLCLNVSEFLQFRREPWKDIAVSWKCLPTATFFQLLDFITQPVSYLLGQLVNSCRSSCWPALSSTLKLQSCNGSSGLSFSWMYRRYLFFSIWLAVMCVSYSVPCRLSSGTNTFLVNITVETTR